MSQADHGKQVGDGDVEMRFEAGPWGRRHGPFDDGRSAFARTASGHSHWRGIDLRQSGADQMGGGLHGQRQGQRRGQDRLSVCRVWRRDRTDQGPEGGFRRERQALVAGGTGKIRARPVSRRDRRRGPSGEHPRRRNGPDQIHRPSAGGHFSWEGDALERS